MIGMSLTSVGVQLWKHQTKFTRNTISMQTSVGVRNNKALRVYEGFFRVIDLIEAA